MRIRASIPFASLFLCVRLACAQQPVPVPAPAPPEEQQEDAPPPAPQPTEPQGGLQSAPPPTPAEQRDKEIRMYDPLDKTDPAHPPADPSLPDTDSRRNTAPVGTEQNRVAPPLPGSVAASSQSGPVNPRRQGPRVVDDSGDAPVQEYTGPAVLSRSYTLARPMVPRQVRWSYTLGLSSIFDTGLTGGKVNTDGTLANVDSFGTSVSWAVSGRHFWKRDQIGLAYSGSVNRYSGSAAYSGQNHSLTMDYGHEFSRRLVFNLVETGLIFSQGFALENPLGSAETSIANLNLAASPTVQILDQGTRQSSSMADLTWHQSGRLSFNFGGGLFFVQHTGVGLFGTTGYQAQADVNYRYSRKMTVGIYYSFSDYVYTQHVEVSNTETLGGIFSYALSRSAQIRLRAGASRSENQGLSSVMIDPAIAALFGRTSAIIEAYHLSTTSDISGEIAKDFGRRRTANISYSHGIAPGNGVILASVQESVAAGGTMQLFRTYALHTSVGYSSLSSASQSVGKYASKYATVSLSRSLRKGVGLNFSFDYRLFALTNEATPHNQIRVSTGISWGPGEGKLW